MYKHKKSWRKNFPKFRNACKIWSVNKNRRHKKNRSQILGTFSKNKKHGDLKNFKMKGSMFFVLKFLSKKLDIYFFYAAFEIFSGFGVLNKVIFSNLLLVINEFLVIILAYLS